MDKQKILEKIKKCLALSQSANEHEAAQALKHAQALMKQHSLSDADVALSDISEIGIKCAQRLPIWQHYLISLCAKAFGAQAYGLQDFNGKTTQFYGIGNRPELAAYAYEVLLRQIRAARREYMKTALNRVSNSRNKTYRADEFCKGWISAVWHKVQAFALTPKEQDLMTRYQAELGEIKTAKPRQVKAASSLKVQAQLDRWRGQAAGEKVELHHGVSGAAKMKQIGVN
ncbi:DUF2786 domain-containing protein [Kingella kingae]|uniref:DUF2786 domain-containing protein n=3 Tax=Kingella kingae TaxID=504 RepID=UPI00254FDD27|nr:DUF2786 domain-containing protein [Kingella kingae]MDK4577480.1 DUF2786 domain-containing protein [Kingella kingae]MDK4583304.1 DUF2786 domain-containing protein [Kingella kingae]MDK4593675.1 DUF2786 domain-containing protein [Kingella kingae]MDK4595656.1 DUF2786 domain-containing protein [Kingella kingae]MDK4645129.1 DUF2786 domain-containing protein [Kingella kingae]